MAGNNRVQVTLGFNADTTQAQQAIKQLNQQLTNIQNLSLDNLGINAELKQASSAAKTLQTALQAAFNVDTGKVNMTTFSQQLKLVGTDVATLGASLRNAGTQGQAAFAQLSKSISLMDVPIKSVNKTLSTMMTTLKNTAKWEMSSTAIHGIEKAFSNALNYVEDLNSALTDIRVVSGQSTEQMAKFAVQANLAAKELGTSTKEYAKAALTYYQQGDSAAMAAKKAEITLKATNVAFKATASEMSEMLTSTWNGFQAGADELEHYVDVMANLGRHTASSVEEIATALQKVAATANTVGVSMEQVSAMIATVSSTTRQAAATVGTAMNTILSRFESLKLGETLEDGLDLTKYTKALKTIGVNVLDINGELRNMGTVVDEIMEKWQTLSAGQKTALANTVGGVRQYTNIMALFNNQQKYQENLAYAQNSDGALEAMQETYLEGIEAAKKRLQASKEELWGSLINEKDILSATKAMTGLVEEITNVVNSLGGLKGIATSVGGLLVNVFSKQIGASITNTINQFQTFKASFEGMTKWQGFKSFFKETTNQRTYNQMNNQFQQETAKAIASTSDPAMLEQYSAIELLLQKKQELSNLSSQMSQQDLAAAQSQLNMLQLQADSISQLGQEYKTAEQSVQSFVTQIKNSTEEMQKAKTPGDIKVARGKDEREAEDVIKNVLGISNFNGGLLEDIKTGQGNTVDQLITRYSLLNDQISTCNDVTNALHNYTSMTWEQAEPQIISATKALEAYRNELQNANQSSAANEIDKLITKLQNADSGNFISTLDEVLKKITTLESAGTVDAGNIFSTLAGRLKVDAELLKDFANGSEEARAKLVQLLSAGDNFTDMASKMKIGAQNLSKSVSQIAQSLGSAVMGFNAFSNGIGNWDTSNAAAKLMSLSQAITVVGQTVNAVVNGNWIGAIIMTAVTVAGIIDGITKRAEKAAETAFETSKQDYKDLEESQKKNKVDNSVLTSYNELYATYEKTGTKQEELVSSAEKLADAYNITGASVLLASGNFDEFNKRLREAVDIAKEGKDLQDLLNAGNTSMSNFVATKDSQFKSVIGYSGNNAAGKMQDFSVQNEVPGNVQITSQSISAILGAMTSGEKESEFVDKEEAERAGLILEAIFAKYLNDIDLTKWAKEWIPGREPSVHSGNTLYESAWVTGFSTEAWQALFDYLNIDQNVDLGGLGTSIGTIVQFLPSLGWDLNKAIQGENDTTKSTGIISEIYQQQWDTNLDQRMLTLGLSEKTNNGIEMINPSTLEGYELAQWLINNKQFLDELITRSNEIRRNDKYGYKNNPEYKTLQNYIQRSKLYTSEEDVLEQAQSYLDNNDIATLQINASTQLTEFVGQSIEDLNGIQGFYNKYNALAAEIDAHREDYASLDGLDINSQEYFEARHKIIMGALQDKTALESQFNLMQTLSEEFGDNSDQIVSWMQNNNFTALEDIIPYINRLKLLIANGTNLTTDEGLKHLVDTSEKEVTSQDSLSKYTNAVTAQSKLKSKNMTADDYTAIYDAYSEFDTFNWDTFVAKDYDGRTKYLQNIVDSYLEVAKKDAELLQESTEQDKVNWEENFKEFLKNQGFDYNQPKTYKAYFEQRNSIMTDLERSFVNSSMTTIDRTKETGDMWQIDKDEKTGKYVVSKITEEYNDQLEAMVESKDEQGEYESLDEVFDLIYKGTYASAAAYEAYMNALAEGEGYDVAIEEAQRAAAAIAAVESSATSATENISKLSSAFSSLPTSSSDMSSLLSLLSDNNLKHTIKNSSGNTIMTWDYTAEDLFNMSDSERESLMIEAAKAEYDKLTNENEKAIKANEIKQMENTHEQNEITRDLRDETETLSQLKSEASALSSIDLAKAPKIGTAAYKALNKEIQDMNKYLNATDLEKVGMLYSAQRSNLQKQISTQQMFASRYSTKADGTSYGFTLDQDLTNMTNEEFAQWQKWSAVQQEIVALQEKITESYESESEKRIAILEEEANIIQTRLSKAKEEATKLETAASTLSKAVETGKLTATDKLNLSDEQIAKWNTLTTAEQRAAYAAQLYADAVIASNDAYEEYNKSIQTANDILNNKADNDSWMSRNYNKKITSSSDFTKMFGNNETLLSAYESAIKDKAISSSSTVSKVIIAVQNKLSEMGEEGEKAAAKIEAAGVDAMLSIYQTAVEKEQSAADQAVTAWQTAFDTIAAARKAMYENNELSEDVLTDPTKLAALAKSAGYTSTKDFMNDYRSGKITGKSFRQLRYDQELFEQQAGINTLQQAFINGTDQNGHETYGAVTYEQAKQNLINRGAATAENVDLILENALTQMLKTSGITDEKEIAKTIDTYKHDLELATGDALFQAMNNASEVLEVTGKNKEMFDQYNTQQDLITQAQNQYTKETEQAQKDLEKYQNYSSLATSAMGRSSGTLAATTLGEDTGTMLVAMNELLGTNKASVEAFTPEQWSQAAATWDSMAVQEQTKIASAGDALAATLEEIATKIAEIMGVDSIAAQNANKTAKEAKETATANNQKVSSLETATETGTISRWAEYAGVDEEKMKDLAEAFENLDSNTKVMKENTSAYREELYKCAAMVEQTRAAVDKMQSTYKNNIATLKKGKTATDDYIDAMAEVKTNIANIFNVEEKYISNDFVTEHLQDYEDLAKGVEGAADKISTAIRNEIIGSERLNKEINVDINEDGILDQLGTIESIFDDFQNNYSNLEIGANIDTSSALAGLDALLSSGVMTANEITAALNSIGWEPEIEYEEVPVSSLDSQSVTGTVIVRLPTGEVQTGTIQGNEEAWANAVALIPHLKSATKTGSSGTRSGSNPKPSGGGGGGAKKHEQDKKAPERYHQVSRALSAQQDLLNKNDKLKSRKYGTSYIDGLTKENTLLKEQIKLNEQKLKEAQGYLASDRAELASYGAIFDAQGNVDFYAYQKKWDDWITSQGLKEMEEEEWKKVEKEYEKAMDALKNYEEAQDTIREQEQAILEAQNKISENLKEAALHKMEIKVDLNDRELKLLEHLIKRYEKDLKKQADNYGYMMAESNEYLENLTATEEALNDLMTGAGLSSLEDINSMINGMLNGGSMTVSDFNDGLNEMYDQIMDNLDALVELRENLLEFYGEVIQKGEEEISKFTDTLSHHINMMEKYLTILNLISDGIDYEKQNEILTTQYQIGLEQIEVQQNKLQMYYDQRSQLTNMLYNEDGTINEKAKQDLEALTEQIHETEEEITDSAQNTMETVRTIYENTIHSIYDNLRRLATSTGESLDWIKQTKWDWWKEDQDRFVDSITKVYEIDKLTRKIENSIANDRSKYNQEQLKALEETINLRAQNNDLAEYDLELYELQYQLLLAKQNLENAQNAKDTVRLTRDENGNMIYQYSANQDRISEAQQKYNDALYEINQLTEQRIRELNETRITLEQEMADALEEIMMDQTLSEEEYLARRAEIEKRYGEQIMIIEQQLQEANKNMLTNQTVISERFGQNLVDTGQRTRDQTASELQSMMNDSSKWLGYTQDANRLASEAAETYRNRLDKVANDAGVSWENIQNKMKDFQTESQKARNEANKTTNELQKQLNQINTLTAGWQTFDSKITASINKFESLATRINNATAALIKLKETENSYSNVSNSTSNNNNNNNNGNNNNGNGNNGNGNNSNNNGNNNNDDKIYNVTYTAQYGKTVNGHFQILGSVTGKGSNKNLETAKSWAYRDASEQVGYGLQIVNGGYFYKSGGLADFTGPAWLDGSKQKPEYILNAEQTEQMFSILNSNTITKLLDTMTMATQAMMAGLGMTMSGNIMNRNVSNSSHAEGNYYITANFPDAKDHNEIELALKNLMNYSSQQFNSLTL